MQRFFYVLCCWLLFTQSSQAQIINSYARVTGITGATLTISNIAGEIDETAGAFAAGQQVIVMQMQDNVIGTTADVATFGNVGSIASAGLYEITSIISRAGTSITLASLVNTFNIGANSSVQLISFPTFCTRGATSGLAWNGNIGGVVAFRCPGAMTLTGNIIADAIGFQGGAVSANSAGACETTPYRSNSTNYGQKGRSIYKVTNADYNYAAAHLLNGGGGGISHNGGGGGGGNFTAGGQGGRGWNSTNTAIGCTPSAGGYGGLTLQPYINLNRVFMGGGGGGANQNNSFGTAGARGGGIIIIEATQLITTGCPAIQIRANGANSGNTTGGGNDSAGGAGAGGSIVFRVGTFNLSASCPLEARANGGTGGTALFGAIHGGGGGGGQGVVIFSNGCPNTIANINVFTNNGSGGCNNNSNPCNSFSDPGQGNDGDGIICDALLPVEWLSVYGGYDESPWITWTVLIDNYTSHFEIERSNNGHDWKQAGTMSVFESQQRANRLYSYLFQDKKNDHTGVSYYRIKQFDLDGSFTYSSVVAIRVNVSEDIQLYPNPSKNTFVIQTSHELSNVQVFAPTGQEIALKSILKTDAYSTTCQHQLAAGVYLLKISFKNGRISIQKLVVEK